MGRLVSIVYRPKGAPTTGGGYTRLAVQEARLVAGYGIEGDAKGGGSDRHLNIMSAETMRALGDDGFVTGPGQLGEQLAVEGLAIDGLPKGARLRLGGSAVIEVVEPRVGCGKFEEYQGKPRNEAAGRMGVMARVIEGGPISVGDTVALLDAAGSPVEPSVFVASYYFGNYHPGDRRNSLLKGPDWSEWELVKAARPRFAGHRQPNVPLWGYEDEADPAVMARKIDAAADHGVDAFLFDWYWYDDGPFLERPIDEGFLKAANNGRLKFALMWANHDWIDIHPYRRGARYKTLYPGKVTPATFDVVCEHVLGRYFLHPSYWRVDGRPYFSFYELTKLLESFGSVAATRAALDRFRDRAAAAGLPGLHLNAVVWGQPLLPGEQRPADPAQLVSDLGFDSVTSYVWIHHVPLPDQQTDYDRVRDQYLAYWDHAERTFAVPYFPNVSMGWDSSPRAHQEDEFGNFGYPFTNTISGNTPERFRRALEIAKGRLLAREHGPRIMNINCWNEWTEGSYLEPDTVHGMAYLEAVRDVFRD